MWCGAISLLPGELLSGNESPSQRYTVQFAHIYMGVRPRMLHSNETEGNRPGIRQRPSEALRKMPRTGQDANVTERSPIRAGVSGLFWVRRWVRVLKDLGSQRLNPLRCASTMAVASGSFERLPSVAREQAPPVATSLRTRLS
jgi:hypothetical protein